MTKRRLMLRGWLWVLGRNPCGGWALGNLRWRYRRYLKGWMTCCGCGGPTHRDLDVGAREENWHEGAGLVMRCSTCVARDKGLAMSWAEMVGMEWQWREEHPEHGLTEVLKHSRVKWTPTPPKGEDA